MVKSVVLQNFLTDVVVYFRVLRIISPPFPVWAANAMCRILALKTFLNLDFFLFKKNILPLSTCLNLKSRSEMKFMPSYGAR